MTNCEALCKAYGQQGGSIHQFAHQLGVSYHRLIEMTEHDWTPFALELCKAGKFDDARRVSKIPLILSGMVR